MARPVSDILADLLAFPAPANPMRDWGGFVELFAELRETGGLPSAIPDVLGYFERHPTARLISALWTVAHALEHQYTGQFEAAVLESVRRQPSDFAVRLASRIACHGRPEVDGVCVVDVLEGALARVDNAPEVRRVLRMALAFARAPDG
jgi:hypothetical protein